MTPPTTSHRQTVGCCQLDWKKQSTRNSWLRWKGLRTSQYLISPNTLKGYELGVAYDCIKDFVPTKIPHQRKVIAEHTYISLKYKMEIQTKLRMPRQRCIHKTTLRKLYSGHGLRSQLSLTGVTNNCYSLSYLSQVCL